VFRLITYVSKPDSGTLRFASCNRLLPGVEWNCSSTLLLVANAHHNCIECTKEDVRLRTPDDGYKGCPKHVVSNTNRIGIQCFCWFYSQGIQAGQELNYGRYYLLACHNCISGSTGLQYAILFFLKRY